MTTTIWILKGVIALIFTLTGTYKMFLSKAKLLDKGMKGLTDLNEKQITYKISKRTSRTP